MLDADLKAQLATYLTLLTQPVALVATLDERPASRELDALLTTVADMSPLITYRADGGSDRAPSFRIERVGSDVAVEFAGVPLGHEFSSLVLALLQVGGHPVKLDAALIEQVRDLEGEHHFETYMSLTCHSCPETVQTLNLMSVLNPNLHHVAIDGGLFPDEVAQRDILTVPSVFHNGVLFDSGRMSVAQVLAKLDTASVARTARDLDRKAPFDVLVLGGGPAGAAAAMYAARKGIRTGLLAERFGGQVLDTLSIENLPSVAYTEGPKLAADLEGHVRQYEVDLMAHQRAEALLPADADGQVGVRLAGGASLRAKTLVLAPGARWRSLGVPGEAEYRTRGVTYCPHCDGPLFKGKAVAVIGGGNSGIEAAIDLAGVVAHVTVLEYDTTLRADAVLQRKLASLPNVTVLTHVQTTEVFGDGKAVQGLAYTDRATGHSHRLALAGVFVQIGLLPNTEWLAGAIELTPRGEIVVDAHGRTSVPGVFAAGDATTSPFKQIVTAMGDGATAALAAFDHLIRLPVSEPVAQAA